MKIFTDTSTLYSPQEGKELGFTVLPLSVTVNGNVYKEYAEIHPADFLKEVLAGGTPTSSQPSIGEVMEAYESTDEEILVISMADGLSGTYQSAVSAKESVANGDKIHVINTRTLCGPHRYLLNRAVELRAEGKTLEEIKTILDVAINDHKSFLIPRDFDFLKRGGRMTPTAAAIGSMLKIVPIMTQTEDGGRLEKAGIKRTFKAALLETIKWFSEHNYQEGYRFYVTHAGAPEDAQLAADLLKDKLGVTNTEIHLLSPAFVTQGGPLCVAVQAIKEI